MADYPDRLLSLSEKVSIPKLYAEKAHLAQESQEPSFWQDSARAQKKMRRLSEVNKVIEDFQYVELLMADWLKKPTSENEQELGEALAKLELAAFLSGPHDQDEAVLAVHAGQGGTEACDWAAILARMYERYAASKGWRVEKWDESPGEEAGMIRVRLPGEQVNVTFTWVCLREASTSCNQPAAVSSPAPNEESR